LGDYSYAEPFCGGAAIAVELLMSEMVKEIYLNDKDWRIYCFWWAIINDNKRFVEMIDNTPVDITTWDFYKNVINNVDDFSMTQVGFSTFFVNRTARSGILSGGVIGGRKQSSKYKIYARYNKEELKQRIKNIYNYRNRIHVYCADGCEFLHKLAGRDNFLYYIDPPYYSNGKGLYFNDMKEWDHEKIHRTIHSIGRNPWIMTYDDCDYIRNLYSDFNQFRFELNYSASRYMLGNEILISPTNLLV
jgi:DNA adenine methylase